MGRRGGSIYIATDPNTVLAIGEPGVSTSIGLLGTMIFAPTATFGQNLVTETGDFLTTEAGDHLRTES